MKLKKIRRAIVSVSDKSDLKLILSALKKFNVEIISTGSTFKKIKSMKYNCIEVSSYTGFSEMLDGRIKTLHPKIHAGILNIRNNKKHRSELKKLNISNIDLVIVDLYPFEEKIKKKINTDSLVEYIAQSQLGLKRQSLAFNIQSLHELSKPFHEYHSKCCNVYCIVCCSKLN